MPDFSLTLVLRLTTSKIINDRAKVQIKSEKITPFWRNISCERAFSRFVAPIIDKVLGIRCTSFGYQYNYFCRLRILQTNAGCDLSSVLMFTLQSAAFS